MLAALAMVVVAGGSRDSIPPPLPRPTHTLRWRDAAVAAGSVSLLFLTDNAVQRLQQRNLGGDADRVAGVARTFGEPVAFLGLPLALLAVGEAFDADAVSRIGEASLRSGATAVVAVLGLKEFFGRARPYCACGSGRFASEEPEAHSLPSGHTAMAFALATSLSDGIGRRWASVLLYGAAGATAWSRVYHNRHWLSDVGAGALIGIASARLASGRWRLRGGPRVEVRSVPGGAAVGLSSSF